MYIDDFPVRKSGLGTRSLWRTDINQNRKRRADFSDNIIKNPRFYNPNKSTVLLYRQHICCSTAIANVTGP
jgi:hypothetical protein